MLKYLSAFKFLFTIAGCDKDTTWPVDGLSDVTAEYTKVEPSSFLSSDFLVEYIQHSKGGRLH